MNRHWKLVRGARFVEDAFTAWGREDRAIAEEKTSRGLEDAGLTPRRLDGVQPPLGLPDVLRWDATGSPSHTTRSFGGD